jgi:hypothetical protein
VQHELPVAFEHAMVHATQVLDIIIEAELAQAIESA